MFRRLTHTGRGSRNALAITGTDLTAALADKSSSAPLTASQQERIGYNLDEGGFLNLIVIAEDRGNQCGQSEQNNQGGQGQKDDDGEEAQGKETEPKRAKRRKQPVGDETYYPASKAPKPHEEGGPRHL